MKPAPPIRRTVRTMTTPVLRQTWTESQRRVGRIVADVRAFIPRELADWREELRSELERRGIDPDVP